MDKIKKLIKYKILPIYWAFLTYSLLKPSSVKQTDLWVSFAHMDKLVHFAIFVVLGFLYILSFPKQKFIFFLIIMSLYALITEVLQEIMAMGRTMDILDFLADILGTILGYLLYKKLNSRFLS